MKRKGRTSQRTILFRRNVNRDNEEWAHFLEGYREWLMEWDMLEYGDDWHTAEDVVSEIFLSIIMEPLITNLRPNDSFRHTLIVLCKSTSIGMSPSRGAGASPKSCAPRCASPSARAATHSSMPRSDSSISSKPTSWTGHGTASGRSRPSRRRT